MELSGTAHLTALFTSKTRHGLLTKTPQHWWHVVAEAWRLGLPVRYEKCLPPSAISNLPLPPTPLAQQVHRLPFVLPIAPVSEQGVTPLQSFTWHPVSRLTLKGWQQTAPAENWQRVDVHTPLSAEGVASPQVSVQVPDLHTLAQACTYLEQCRQWVLALAKTPWQGCQHWVLPAFSANEAPIAVPLQPFQGLVQAFLQTLPHAYPQWSVCLLENGDPSPGSQQPLPLPGFRNAAGSFQHLLYAQGRWWQQHPETVPVATAQALPSSLRTEGVYLITGASGGMATVLCDFLQRRYQARLVCLSRQDKPTMTTASSSENLPEQVLWLQGDVTQYADVAQAIAQAYAHFGALHGILHTAGQGHEMSLAASHPEALFQHLSPRVLGLQHVRAVLQQRQQQGLPLPDWVAACSAPELPHDQSLAWAAGQWAYQAGNRWTDAWCAAQSLESVSPQSTSTHYLSLRWGPWQETGMAYRLKSRLPAGLQAQYQAYLDLGLSNALAGERFVQALALGVPVVAIHNLDVTQLPFFNTALSTASPLKPGEGASRRLSWMPSQISALWERYLGQVPADHQRFSELGGDSMAALQLKSALEQELRLEVPLSLLVQDLPFSAFVEGLVSDGEPSRTSPSTAVLVPLNEVPTGERRAESLFFVHPISGTVFPFQHLAQAVERPLIGIQSVGLFSPSASTPSSGLSPHTDIEVMARDYCQAIEAAGYTAPYAVGGWSFGALVAFAMARHWQQRGVAVSELILLDMLPPDPQAFHPEVLQAHFDADVARLWPESTAGNLSATQQAFKTRLETIFKAHVQATQSFVPSALSVPTQVLVAQQGLIEATESSNRCAYAQQAWEAYLTNLTVRSVPGDHYSCLSPEAVAQWATWLEPKQIP